MMTSTVTNRRTLCLVPLLAAALTLLLGPTPSPAAPAQGALRCVKGLAGPYPCRFVDQEALVKRAALGAGSGLLGTVAAWRDEESEREFALVAHPGAVAVVEVTNPRAPRVLGELAPTAEGRVVEVAVYGDLAYVLVQDPAVGGAVDVFDLHSLLSEAVGTQFEPVAEFAVDGRPRLEIDAEAGRGYLYHRSITQPARIVGLDLADPLAPAQLFDAELAGLGGVQALECFTYHGPEASLQGRNLCATAGFPSHLRIYDVTDGEPVRLGSATYPRARWPWRVAVTPDHRFVLLGDSHDEHFFGLNTRTFVFDIRDPNDPVLSTRADGPSKTRDLDLAIRGKFAYLAVGRDGLRILDLRRLADGKIKTYGWFDIDPASQSNNWFGAIDLDVLPSGIVLLVDSRQGLYLLAPTLPGAPG